MGSDANSGGGMISVRKCVHARPSLVLGQATICLQYCCDILEKKAKEQQNGDVLHRLTSKMNSDRLL